MAFTQLSDSKAWGSSPKIYFDVYYEKRRSGADQQYRMKFVCAKLTGTHYFGYNIKIQIKYGSTVKDSVTLKDNSPSQWSSSKTWTSDWFTISNKTSGTTEITVRIYSNSGRDKEWEYNLPIDPAQSTLTVGTGDLGSNISLKVTRYSTAFTHTITASVGDNSVTACTKSTATSLSVYVPLRWLKGYAPGAEITVTYKITTYNGSTSLGTKTVTGKVTVPDVVAYVWNGSAWKQAVCYVWNGSAWKEAKSSVYASSKWKI